MQKKSMNNGQLSIVQSKSKGFTLIELLTVIAIIGILASIAIASYSNAQAKSRDSRRKTDLDAIRKSLELAKQDTPGAYYYPSCPSAASNCQITNSVETQKYDGTGPNPLHPSYIPNIPTDPKSATGYYYLLLNASSAACTINCVSYKLIACLENANDSQQETTIYTSCSTASYSVSPS